MHDLPLVATIAAAFTSAWLLGLLTQRLGLSPIVGYLLAGVLIGPHTPGFSGDLQIAHQLAEVGVILLMFGVGLHFHLKDLLAVKGVAIPGAIVQSAVAIILTIVIFHAFGLSTVEGAVLGMAMAVASTVVLMRVLMDADALRSPPGHVAVGWLIVEDFFTIILLVLIPVLGSGASAPLPHPEDLALWQTIGLALLKIAALVAIVLLAGSRVVPWVLIRVARLRSRELFTLTVLVFSIAIAAGAYYFFGASMALGAFLAGMVVAQSPVSHQAAADALPMRDAFAVLFFVSVGMLFDPAFLIEQPGMVAAALGVILIAKPMAALAIVAVLGHSARTALTVAIGLAQIGEFSFILAELARRNGLMDAAGQNVIVAAAILSISLNPLLFRSLPAIERWLRARPRLWSLLNRRAEQRAIANSSSIVAADESEEPGAPRLAIVVGFGPVGRAVHSLLRDARLSTVIVDLNLDTVLALNAQGQPAIYGDAANEGILAQAGVRRASYLVLTLPHSYDRVAVVATARAMNSAVRILVRARYLREREELERAGATAAVFEEGEAAVALARLTLADTGVHREAAERKIKDLRLQLLMENISNMRTQRVASVMVPWHRVRWIPANADRGTVLAMVAQAPFSRWPVMDPRTGRISGYLLTRDLLAPDADADWAPLVRPLTATRADESSESVLTRMQAESASLLVVEEAGHPVGIITLEDLIEQVVGQIEDEYPQQARVSLAAAIEAGAVLSELTATTRDEAIAELAAAIPRAALPAEVHRSDIARLALERESEMSTDLGNGVAIPHARCAGLAAPLVVFGRSAEGVSFSTAAESSASHQPVRIFFLLITPAENPEAQLALLSQIARAVATEENRKRILHAHLLTDLLSALPKQP